MSFLRKIFGTAGLAFAPGAPRSRLQYAADDFAAIYAIGDVHGCHAELLAAEARIVTDSAEESGPVLIVMLGDYIDRGPGSSAVLDHICAPPPAGFERITLCGNHEDIFLRFLDAPETHAEWLDWGGMETLASYGIDAAAMLAQGSGPAALAGAARDALPERHLKLLQSLPVLLEVGPLVFVHAGIRPGVALGGQAEKDLIWIREPFLSQGPALPLLVIHGHTPAEEPVFAEGRIGIDTAAFMSGRLTVLKIAGGRLGIL